MRATERHAEARDCGWNPGGFLPVTSQEYSDIQQFFVREAILLDRRLYQEWCCVFARDVRYSARSSDERLLRTGADREALEYDFSSIVERINRLALSANSSSESPQFTLRRFVSNLSVCFGDCRDEYEVVSYVLAVRHTHTQSSDSTDVITAERRDRLRRRDRTFAVARREILIDRMAINPLIEGMFL